MQHTTKRARYQQFCKQINAPIFIQAWYLDLVCRDGGSWDAAMVEEEGQLVGVMPYFYKSKYGFNYITMPIGAKYMGPYLLPEKNSLSDQHQLYEKLIKQLPNVDSFWQNFYPQCSNWLPFYWQGYRQTTRYTYRLNIADPDKVFRDLSDKTRYKLRKAKKIVAVVDDLPPEAFHRVHIMSFQRQKLPPPFSLETFLDIHKTLSQHDTGKMFFAVDEEQNIHSVLYVLLDGDTSYMHFLGSNPAFPKSESVNFLYWQVFQYLSKEKGIKWIDFQGGMMKNVENIFRRFRAEQTPYFSITKENSKLFKFIQYLKN
ncbi:MAG: GNAT family N-acetyltransferase [Bacteroidota bacterium]